jgi:hypothetical protein
MLQPLKRGPHSRYGHCEAMKNLLPLIGIEPQLSSLKPILILTAVSQEDYKNH